MNKLIDRNLPSWKIQDSTKIKCFCDCPRKYFFEYVLGWRPETPNNHLAFGQAWHAAVEYLFLNDYSTKSVVQAHEIFTKTYRRYFPPETDSLFFPKTPENAMLALARYAGRFKEDLSNFNVLYTEIAGRITVSENKFVNFRMDSILENKRTKQIISVDHKTGSRTWGWENQFPLSHQTGTYTHVLYCMYPKDLVQGLVYRGVFFGSTKKAWEQLQTGSTLTYKDPLEFIEFPAYRSVEQMESWLWHINFWLDQIEWQFELLSTASETDPVMFCFPQNPGACTDYGGCPFFEYCNAWMNPLQRADEPPPQMKEDHWDPTKEEAKHVFNL